MTTQLAIASNLYGATDDYTNRLLDFCTEHDWTLHPNQHRACSELLDTPGHRCNTARCLDDAARQTLCGEWFNFDHTVLLRRGEPARPTQWAILSQPYSDRDPSGCAVNLGPAPYGHGTTALLYIGRAERTTA